MVRVLLLIILIGLIYWVIIRLIASYKSNQDKAATYSHTQSDQNKSNEPDSNLKIVQCSRCGCHVPENESRQLNEQVVCNNKHCNES